MTHQEESAVFEAVTAILIEHGPAAMASAFAIIMNCAMQIEREQVLTAETHQRTADRQGYANGFKPKTIHARAGVVHLRIPQTRDYHDDEGRPFYPKSLVRGLRSERAMTLAVAEMYVQGVSTRKVTKIDEELAAWRNRPLGEVTTTDDIRRIYNADDRAEADRRLKDMVGRYHKTAPALASWLEEDIPEASTVFAFPAAHRKRRPKQRVAPAEWPIFGWGGGTVRSQMVKEFLPDEHERRERQWHARLQRRQHPVGRGT